MEFLRLVWAVSVIQAKSYWPSMVLLLPGTESDVLLVTSAYMLKIQLYALYPRLVDSFPPWEDANIDFMVGLPEAQCNKSSNML